MFPNDYPKYHKRLVTALMNGQFITSDVDEDYFNILKKYQSDYIKFFDRSFGYELKIEPEFCYLVSEETDEKTSRDISIFFSIFCYELEQDNRSFIDELTYSRFPINEIADYIQNSVDWKGIVEHNKQLNSPENFKKWFEAKIVKRNIAIKHPDDKYSFTKAYKLFIDFCARINKSKWNEYAC